MKLLWIYLAGVIFLMAGCQAKTLQAPCDDYGRNCDPKVKINQWTP